jgi:hypothetical protein
VNYGQLKQEVLDIAKLTLTDTVGARIAAFIRRAEGMIAQYVRALEMIDESGTIVEGDRVNGGVYDLPADFLQRLAVFGILSGQGYQVTPVALSELRSRPSSAPALWHAIYGRRIEFRGAPSTGEAFDLIYFARPAAMTADADERDLLTAHESLYINGALHWLYLDAHDSDLATVHKAGFMADAESINKLAKAAIAAGVVAMPYNFESGSAM